eukprot:4817967-Amphidinium_carterae.1
MVFVPTAEGLYGVYAADMYNGRLLSSRLGQQTAESGQTKLQLHGARSRTRQSAPAHHSANARRQQKRTDDAPMHLHPHRSGDHSVLPQQRPHHYPPSVCREASAPCTRMTEFSSTSTLVSHGVTSDLLLLIGSPVAMRCINSTAVVTALRMLALAHTAASNFNMRVAFCNNAFSCRDVDVRTLSNTVTSKLVPEGIPSVKSFAITLCLES